MKKGEGGVPQGGLADYITSLRPCYPRPSVYPLFRRRRRPRPLTRSRSRTLKRSKETDADTTRRLRKCGARCECGDAHVDPPRRSVERIHLKRRTPFSLMPRWQKLLSLLWPFAIHFDLTLLRHAHADYTYDRTK